VVFYDLTLNPAALDERIGQFIHVGRTSPAHIYAFTDESDTLMIERRQRKAIEMKQAVGIDEVNKLLFDDDI
jgi:hypothetical protein